MTGTVKNYKSKFGYGFIETESGEQLFFTAGKREIEPGTKVKYESVIEERKGLKAEGIEIED